MNLMLVASDNNAIWETKSFNTFNCLNCFQENNISICHNETNINITDPNNAPVVALLLSFDPSWKITISYQNDIYNVTELCMEEFENKGFSNCTAQVNDTQPVGSFHDGDHAEL